MKKTVLFSLGLLFAGVLAAQEFRATISGVVSDPTGAPVPGARIIVTNISTNVSTSTTSNTAGVYAVPYLSSGTYQISVTAGGFETPFCGGLITAALVKYNSWAKLPEIDAMLERVARWLLTEMWQPDGIMSKGGSPRRTASPGHIASHMRLLRRVYENTRDPLFLAVPRELMLAGFGADADIKTRSTGLVLNYVPWFMDLLESEELPAPDAEWSVAAKTARLALRPGGTAQACFDLSNSGTAEITGVRISFQPRLDFTATTPAAIDSMRPGQRAELCYPVRAPEEINLTSQYNRAAYAQWTALGRRQGKPVVAHTWVRLELRVDQPSTRRR